MEDHPNYLADSTGSLVEAPKSSVPIVESEDDAEYNIQNFGIEGQEEFFYAPSLSAVPSDKATTKEATDLFSTSRGQGISISDMDDVLGGFFLSIPLPFLFSCVLFKHLSFVSLIFDFFNLV